MMSDVLAIDCGQSGSRARLTTTGRRGGRLPPVEAEYGPVFTQRPLEPQLASLISRAADNISARNGDLTVAVGSSGWSEHGDLDEVARQITSDRVRRVILAHDSVTSYLGALGGGRDGGVPAAVGHVELGAVVAAGTGVVTLGVGENRVARVDGWGYLFGDAGSGYWIGRAAIDCVLQAYDGRGPQTALTEVVTAEFPDLSTLYLEVQADPEKVKRVARYAKAVAELAGSDPVAARISHDAGRRLAESVSTALRVVGLEEKSPAVARVGKVFSSGVLREAFDESLRNAVPGVRIAENPGTALDGAALLADLPPSSALYPLIKRADLG